MDPITSGTYATKPPLYFKLLPGYLHSGRSLRPTSINVPRVGSQVFAHVHLEFAAVRYENGMIYYLPSVAIHIMLRTMNH